MAIVQKPLKCSSCGAKTIVRVAIGHFGDQTHTFPCPSCDVPISFILAKSKRLKIPKLSFKKLSNARWVKDNEGAVTTLTFDPDRVAPADGEMAFSPFIDESHKLSRVAHAAFAYEERLRRDWCGDKWPWISKMIVHFNNRNLVLFDKEARLDKKSPNAASWASRLVLLYALFEKALDNFTLNRKSAVERVRQRLALAKSISPQLFDQLTTDLVSTGRIRRLWDELTAIRGQFCKVYPAIAPVLRMQYWKASVSKEATKFAVPDKRFDDLKHLYVDSFETLCRLLVLAVGIETIIHHRSLDIPTNKGTMSLWDFEAMANGNKHTILQQFPIFELFVPFIDSKLRNGIGHHSAVYDAKTDEVVYYSGATETRLPYTDFVSKVLQLYSVLELAAYFHAIHIRAVETE